VYVEIDLRLRLGLCVDYSHYVERMFAQVLQRLAGALQTEGPQCNVFFMRGDDYVSRFGGLSVAARDDRVHEAAGRFLSVPPALAGGFFAQVLPASPQCNVFLHAEAAT